MNVTDKNFSLSKEAEKRVEELLALYPDKRSAVMPILYIVQEEKGYIPDEAIDWVSSVTSITPAHVLELVTFYTMYRRKPLGRYHIQICRTLSCAVCGAAKLKEYIKERLKVPARTPTEDGMWSWEEVECLGSCGTAPMCEINDIYFENLTPEKLGEIMDKIEKEKPDLSFSTVKDTLGKGLSGYPKSEVYQEEK